MNNFCEAKDWAALKSAAHKAKSTFAYLSLDDMRDRLKNIEHSAMEGEGLEKMPQMVAEAIEIGEAILAKLKVELAKLM
jgi:HPt (histidine-containing phosphotransfer) domain-containing protein